MHKNNDENPGFDEKTLEWLRNLWVENRMTYDRMILQLSVGGIGVLVTLITAFGGNHSIWYLIPAFCFVVSIICCLLIFSANADYITKIINKSLKTRKIYWLDEIYRLDVLDISTRCFFIAAVISSFIVTLFISHGQ